MKSRRNAECAKRARQSVGTAKCCANGSNARDTDPGVSTLAAGGPSVGVQNQLSLRARGARSAEKGKKRREAEAAAGTCGFAPRHQPGGADRRKGARNVVLAPRAAVLSPALQSRAISRGSARGGRIAGDLYPERPQPQSARSARSVDLRARHVGRYRGTLPR